MISLSKTEVLYQLVPRDSYVAPNIDITRKELNPVLNFTYLGSVISSYALIDKDIDSRLAKAFGRLYQGIWNCHSIKRKTKVRVYRAAVM